MTCNHYKLAHRLLFVLYLATMFYLCFAMPDKLPEVKEWKFPIPADKCAHFLMFAPFPILASLWSGMAGKGLGKQVLKISCILAVGIALAWATELVQGALGYRSKDEMDFIADLLGLATSSVLWVAFLRFYEKSRTR